METKRPETVGPRDKESKPRVWRDAQQWVNQAAVLTNLSARQRASQRLKQFIRSQKSRYLITL